MATAKRDPGRPSHTPNARTKDEVELAAAVGLAHEDIANSLGISRSTLEKYYTYELSTGAYNRRLKWHGMLEKSAAKGNVAAQKALLVTKPHWAPPPLVTSAPEEAEKTAKPAKLGIKEQRQLEARTAAQGTGWSGLLPRSTLQ